MGAWTILIVVSVAIEPLLTNQLCISTTYEKIHSISGDSLVIKI